MVGPDNLEYAAIAHSLTRGHDVYAQSTFAWHIGRLSIVAPLAASMALLGSGEARAAAWPLLCSMGSVLLAFAFARRLAGAAAGLVAAAFLAAHPLEVLYATTPLPDPVMALCLGLAVWLFDRALDRDGGRARGLYAAAGAAIGVAYYGRITALVVLGVLALWLLWRRGRPTWEMAFVAVGALAVVAAGTAFIVSRGGPITFELTQTVGLAGATQLDVIDYGVQPLFGFAGGYLLDPKFGRWTVLFLASALVLLVLRDRRLLPLGMWLTVWYVFLEFVSQYPVLIHSLKEERYTMPLLLPMALVVGVAAQRLGERLPAPRSRAAVAAASLPLMAVLLAPTFDATERYVAVQRQGLTRPAREVAAFLRDVPPRPVYLTYDWRNYVNFFGDFSFGFDVLDPSTYETARLRKLTVEAGGRPVGVDEGYVFHDERFGLAVPTDWQRIGRVAGPQTVYYAPSAARPDSTAYALRLSVERPVGAGLTVAAFGSTREPTGQAVSVALDWTSGVPPTAESVSLTLRDRAGAVAGSGRFPLAAAGTLPSVLWQPDGIYRQYYDLTAAAPREELELLVGVDDGAPVSLGKLVGPPAVLRVEAERLEGVTPVADPRALPSLVGWGSYVQASYSGARAAITRTPGARAAATTATEAGPRRLWVQVYSYGPGVNRLELLFGDERREVAWRSGAPGLGRVAVEFDHVGAGAPIALVAKEVGQLYLVVDAIDVAPAGE